MLSLMKQTAHAPVNEDNRPSELGEITFGVPDVDRLDQADGILRRNAPISAADEEILFKTMELCAAVGERGERRRSDESRSLEDIDDLRRNIIARLVEQNVPLVHAMRKRYSMVGMDPDEMLSEGCWTLYRAVKGFDVWRGLRFSTYACRSILYSFLSLAKKRRREREVLEGLVKERPTVTHPSDLETGVDGPMFMDQVNEALFGKSAGFTEIECCVIEQRFLASSQNGPATLESLGQVFQLSKERIRQIQRGALAKLRTVLTHRSTLGSDVALAFSDRD